VNEKEKSDEFKKERKKERNYKVYGWTAKEERRAEMKINEKKKSEEMTTEKYGRHRK
jgi:hypothetical protein